MAYSGVDPTSTPSPRSARVGGVIILELSPSPIPPFLAQLHAPQRLVRRDPRVAAAERDVRDGPAQVHLRHDLARIQVHEANTTGARRDERLRGLVEREAVGACVEINQ